MSDESQAREVVIALGDRFTLSTIIIDGTVVESAIGQPVDKITWSRLLADPLVSSGRWVGFPTTGGTLAERVGQYAAWSSYWPTGEPRPFDRDVVEPSAEAMRLAELIEQVDVYGDGFFDETGARKAIAGLGRRFGWVTTTIGAGLLTDPSGDAQAEFDMIVSDPGWRAASWAFHASPAARQGMRRVDVAERVGDWLRAVQFQTGVSTTS